MKFLISIEEISKLKCRDLVTCECEQCHQPFHVTKNIALRGLKGSEPVKFCSLQCKYD